MLLTNHSAPAGHVTPCSPLIGSRFQNICSADRQYNIDSISAVSELMDTMANLFGSVDVFGSFDEAKSRARIQDGKEYVRNVVVSQLRKPMERLYEPNAVCWPISPRDCHFSL